MCGVLALVMSDDENPVIYYRFEAEPDLWKAWNQTLVTRRVNA